MLLMECIAFRYLLIDFSLHQIQKKKPGHESGHTMCLWNGFLMSAPGHPILAKVIETVVNNVRNRFTSLDVMNTLCPNVHFSVGFKFKVLFTSKSLFLFVHENISL